MLGSRQTRNQNQCNFSPTRITNSPAKQDIITLLSTGLLKMPPFRRSKHASGESSAMKHWNSARGHSQLSDGIVQKVLEPTICDAYHCDSSWNSTADFALAHEHQWPRIRPLRQTGPIHCAFDGAGLVLDEIAINVREA